MHKKKCSVGTHEGKIRGSESILLEKAYFSGEKREHIGSLFFEHTKKIKSHSKLFFREKTKKMFFFRVEKFSSAEIQCDISVEKNAKIFFVFLVHDQEISEGRIKINADIKEGASLYLSAMHLGKGKIEIEKNIFLREKNAHAETLFTEIAAKKSDSIVRIHHNSCMSETSGNIRTRCILSDSAKSNITGVPHVELHAENCKTHLDQKTILLSPAARSISIPQLNIANNKVEASHKSSFVHLDREDEFYLQSRGISKCNIANLLLDGILSETLENIPEEAIQTCLSETAHSFLQKIS